MTIDLNPYLAAKAISSCNDIRKFCIMNPLDELARIRGKSTLRRQHPHRPRSIWSKWR